MQYAMDLMAKNEWNKISVGQSHRIDILLILLPKSVLYGYHGILLYSVTPGAICLILDIERRIE